MNGFKKGLRNLIAIVLSLAVSIPLFSTNVLAASDLTGHWAGNTIQEWIDRGLAKGYGDGSFKPNNNITRAEYMSLVNNAFGLTTKAEIQFEDVKSNDWYYEVIQKAVAAGYIGGYPDGTMKPNSPITRQEAAIVIAKVKSLTQSQEAANQLTDASSMVSWSKGYIGAVVKAGFMKGYPDGSFKPDAQIKRGEAIVALNNAMGAGIYNKAGTYGPATGSETISGDVIISVDGVILQNLVINGNLTIAKEVGDGDVTLNNVIVKGDTYIRGGGENSIHINGGEYNQVIIEKTATGSIRIVAKNAKGMDVVISKDATGEKIILEGKFDSVSLNANNVNIETQGNTEIGEMNVAKGIKSSDIHFGAGTVVLKLSIESALSVRNEGRIVLANVIEGVSFDKAPEKTNSGNNQSNNSGGGGSSSNKPSITGNISTSVGSPDLTTAVIQLKQAGTNVGSSIHPAADGSYRIRNIEIGTGYTITVSLAGYYDFTTASFDMTQGSNISKNIQLARKEPIITTGDITTITRNTSGSAVTLTIDLTSGKDYAEQVENLGHRFAEASIIEDVSNWVIDMGKTGLSVDAITRINDTQVEFDFSGSADTTRAFSIQLLSEGIEGDYAYESNVLTFSVVDDGFMDDSTGSKQVYYAINSDVTDIKGVVVLVHGLAEHLGRYNEVTEALNEAGYITYRIDHKGHGRTGVVNGDKGIVGNYSEYYEDLDLLVDMAISDYPDLPIYMLGHSMGGLITSMYGVTYTDKLDGQILSGAATGPYYLSFGEEADFYNRFGGDPLFMIPNSLTSTVCRYPAVQNYYYVDPLRLNEFSAQLYWKTFAGGSKYLADEVDAGEYTYPVFIIHGGDDRIVSVAFSESFYNNIDSNDKTIKIYDGLFHESLNELNEKTMIMDDIIEWLDERVD